MNDKVRNPERATDGSAGYDLYPNIIHPVEIPSGEHLKIGTGIKIHIKNPEIVGLIMPRSGKGVKGFGLKNFTGTIDSDYQGELIVTIWNTNSDSLSVITVTPDEAFAQILFVPVLHPTFKQVTGFPLSYRGEGGFGSSDKKLERV